MSTLDILLAEGREQGLEQGLIKKQLFELKTIIKLRSKFPDFSVKEYSEFTDCSANAISKIIVCLDLSTYSEKAQGIKNLLFKDKAWTKDNEQYLQKILKGK